MGQPYMPGLQSICQVARLGASYSCTTGKSFGGTMDGLTRLAMSAEQFGFAIAIIDDELSSMQTNIMIYIESGKPMVSRSENDLRISWLFPIEV